LLGTGWLAVDATLGRQTTLFANVNYDIGLSGDRWGCVKFGLRMAW
jgi:hypothetical protein